MKKMSARKRRRERNFGEAENRGPTVFQKCAEVLCEVKNLGVKSLVNDIKKFGAGKPSSRQFNPVKS